jgi:hypothetical protein
VIAPPTRPRNLRYGPWRSVVAIEDLLIPGCFLGDHEYYSHGVYTWFWIFGSLGTDRGLALQRWAARDGIVDEVVVGIRQQ